MFIYGNSVRRDELANLTSHLQSLAELDGLCPIGFISSGCEQPDALHVGLVRSMADQTRHVRPMTGRTPLLFAPKAREQATGGLHL